MMQLVTLSTHRARVIKVCFRSPYAS